MIVMDGWSPCSAPKEVDKRTVHGSDVEFLSELQCLEE